MRRVGLTALASYLPRRVMTADELARVSGIPTDALVERFGLRQKHLAAADEHVSDMAVAAAGRLLTESEVDPASIDAVVYFGSTWKDYPVWQASPLIAHRLGCTQAFALELDYVSCGAPVALRVGRDLLRAEPELRRVLLVGACREGHLLDYGNERARFMFTFADGAVAALLEAGDGGSEVLGCAMRTDGSFALDVKVPAGGSVAPASAETVAAGAHALDVADPADMKRRLDPVSLPSFVAVAEAALKASGATLGEVAHLCALHTKRSMHVALCEALGIPTERATYLDDTGHMSGVDTLLALDRAGRGGALADGDLVLLLAAGTGYTWAASVIRWVAT